MLQSFQIVPLLARKNIINRQGPVLGLRRLLQATRISETQGEPNIENAAFAAPAPIGLSTRVRREREHLVRGHLNPGVHVWDDAGIGLSQERMSLVYHCTLYPDERQERVPGQSSPYTKESSF